MRLHASPMLSHNRRWTSKFAADGCTYTLACVEKKALLDVRYIALHFNFDEPVMGTSKNNRFDNIEAAQK
jgi:hypothetical protein